MGTPGDFSQQTVADWHEQQAKLWEEHWPTIKRILSALRGLGIYYSDPNPYDSTPENPALLRIASRLFTPSPIASLAESIAVQHDD